MQQNVFAFGLLHSDISYRQILQTSLEESETVYTRILKMLAILARSHADIKQYGLR